MLCSSLPAPRAAAAVHDRDDHDAVFLGSVIDAEGKPADESAPGASSDGGVHVRPLADGAEGDKHLV